MVQYTSPVFARWRTPERYLSRKRKRDGKRLEKLERYITVLGKFHMKYQQSQPGVVYEDGLPTRPNTPMQGSGPPPPLPSPAALSYDNLPASSTSKSINSSTNKLTKLKARILRYLRRAQKMPVLTRSVSATSSNRPYLTPHSSSSTHPRALIDMTPLPSLFDKMIEVAKRRKRSISVQLKPKTDDHPFVLPSIPEVPEEPSSDPVEVHDVQQPSDAPTEVEDKPEFEPVAHQPPATSDHMDFEDTPIIFSDPVYPTIPPDPIVPPPAPAPVPPLVYGEVIVNFLPSNPPSIYPGPPVELAPTNQEPLLLSETNSATFPHSTTYYNSPSTSANFGLHFPPQEQAPFQPPQVSEPPQLQIPEHDTIYSQYQTHPPPLYPAALSILSSSAPVQNTMQSAVLPVLAQSFPTFTTVPAYHGLNPQREEPNWFHPPLSPAPAETSYRRPTFAPQAQQRPELEDPFTWWFHPRTRPPSWRIREIERQREMDRIAEPYLAHLREVSRQKKVKTEARALVGRQRADRAEDEPEKSLGEFSREGSKKAQKELKEIERQQRSEEKRQARKDAREKRRRRKSAENMPPEGRETDVSVSPRRKSSGRSKPYSIPHPATRSPRRSHVMPGGFDSDDMMSDQTGDASDVLWNGLKTAVHMGYKLWTHT